MTIPMEKAILALRMLLEGSSIRSVERTTELHRDTIMRLLVIAGEKCERIMGRYVRNIAVKEVECDEAWSYIGKKERRVKSDEDQNLGDAYVFVAIERNTKLVLNIALRKRDQLTTNSFIEQLRDTIAPGTSFQITTDGFAPLQNLDPGHLWPLRRLCNAHQGVLRAEWRRSPLQPVRSSRRAGGPSLRQSRSRPYLYFNRGALQSQPSHGMPTLYPLDERLQQEMEEPLGRYCALVHVLQLLPDSQLVARHSRDTGWYCRSSMVNR